MLSCLLALSGCNLSLLKTGDQVSPLVLVTPSEPTTFNYALNRSPYSIFPFIYEGLLSENGLSAQLEPELAQSWEISEDQQQITFTLREALKWSDGQPLTADDVVFSFQDIYFNQKIPSVVQGLLRIGPSGAFPLVKKLDSRRVMFRAPEPFAPFLRYVGILPILPAHALQKSLQATDNQGNLKFLSTWGTDTEPTKIIGNGSYIMESYTPNQRVVFQRNPYYWRKDTQGNTQPYIERIVWQIIESTDTQLLRFRSGDLDSLPVKSEAFGLLKQEEKRGKYTIYNGGASDGVSFVGFNLNQASNEQGQPFVDPIKSRWFNTLAFRQAVASAINRERMNNNIYQGLGEVQHAAISTHSPYHLSPKAGLKVYNYNPQQARQLLLDAGFQYNPQGQLLDWDGNHVQFTILVKSEDKSRVDAAVQIKQDLSKIGMQADLQLLSFNSVLKKLLSTRDWDCYLGAFEGGGVEPHILSVFWHSQGSFHQFNKGSRPGKPPLKGWVVSDWEQEIDRLFEAGVREFDESKRQEIYGRFQQIVAEELPVFFLVNRLTLQATRDRLANVKFSALGGGFWNLHELTLAEN
ncbi:ABC transporter substrate-binding protein [Lyngbya aestuarii]|uniref:ABC transporter substrate-binding protein n=1 Tax=Lyngbya aestuarii TaxID=118322 RepID=UPI00403DF73D